MLPRRLFKWLIKLFISATLISLFMNTMHFYFKKGLIQHDVSLDTFSKLLSTEISEVISRKDKYIKRAEAIHERCLRSNSRNKIVKLRTDRFKYSDRAKTVVCETPKVASTAWQIALLKLGGFNEEITAAIMRKWAYSMIPNHIFTTLKSEDKAMEILQKYTTILVTRHPFERLVSAYRSKLTNKAEYTLFRDTVGKEIAKEQASEHLHGLSIRNVAHMTTRRLKTTPNFKKLSAEQQKEVLEYSHVLKTGEVSFPQFVKYLTKMKLEDMNTHWRPQTDMCVPCHVNYTYIIHFENLVKESNEVLGWIQQDQTGYNRTQVNIPGNITPFVSDSKTQQYFNELDQDEVEKLRQIYADDFELLNYDRYLYMGMKKC